MRGRLFIEEYSPDIRFIDGNKNIVADALSRLEKLDQPFDDSKEIFSNKLTASVKGYLSWPRISTKPFLFCNISSQLFYPFTFVFSHRSECIGQIAI